MGGGVAGATGGAGSSGAGVTGAVGAVLGVESTSGNSKAGSCSGSGSSVGTASSGSARTVSGATSLVRSGSPSAMVGTATPTAMAPRMVARGRITGIWRRRRGAVGPPGVEVAPDPIDRGLDRRRDVRGDRPAGEREQPRSRGLGEVVLRQVLHRAQEDVVGPLRRVRGVGEGGEERWSVPVDEHGERGTPARLGELEELVVARVPRSAPGLHGPTAGADGSWHRASR